MRKINLSPVLFLLFLFSSEAFAADPIVYSRCKRTTATYELSGTVTVNGEQVFLTRTMRGLDGYDKTPDVENFFGDFSAPCDLVYRDAEGNETVLYDCSTSGSTVGGATCAALDAAVSFDASRIAFSVFRGTLINYVEWGVNSRLLNASAESISLGNKTLPVTSLSASGAELMYHDLSTGQNHTILPYAANRWDSGPAWVSADRLAFTSTRDGHRTTSVFRSPSSIRTGTRIWSVDLDGKNLTLDSHHSLSQEQHPLMLKNGRLAYSSWQILGRLPFRHNNGNPGMHTTNTNLFQVFSHYPDGSENFALCCMHSGDHTVSYYGEDHNAAHFLAQTGDERIWWSDYYRGNNNALGSVIGMIEEPMMEGFSKAEAQASGHQNFFAPRDVVNAATWSTNADNSGNISVSGISHPNYPSLIPWFGKLGYPFALTNGLGVTWGAGNCSIVTNVSLFPSLGLGSTPAGAFGSGSGSYMYHMTHLYDHGGRDVPACDLGIYRVPTIPSTHPSQLELIVDSPDWHEIMARAVVPYSAIHGQPAPASIPPAHIRSTHASLSAGYPFGLLGAASIIDRETEPFGGITFQNGPHPEHQFSLAGTDTIDYTDDELCGVRIVGLMPNRGASADTEIQNVWGERTAILGELHVKHYDGEGARILTPLGGPDTSFLVKLPANTPHITQAIDCDGRTLNTDQTWQTVKPGEMKTCGGCHVHSRAPELEFSQSFAATPGYTIPELGKGTVPLLNGKTGNVVNTRTVSGYGYQVTLSRDVKPIFDARCVSCHGGATPDAGLDLSNTDIADGYTGTGSTWFCLVRDNGQTCVPNDKVVNVEGMYTTGACATKPCFRSPQLTKYVRANNSRGSLLLWKAANQRLDNRLDGDDPEDINFGADHPTTITAEELGILSRWIDLGAAAGPQELKDTHKPTLHMAATVVSNEITQLLIGTVDLGYGINTNSLNVCLVTGSSCGSNLAGVAQSHGITTINLATPISNPNQIIRATVSDSALPANTTQIEYTAAFLMQMAEGAPVSTISVFAGGNATITEGSTFSRTITFTDGEDNDAAGRTYSIDWCGTEQTGSVSAGNFSFNISRLFSTAGSCAISATVTDGTGESDTKSFTLTIDASGPTPDGVVISVGGAGFVREGGSYSRVISFTDGEDSGGNGWTYSCNVDGGDPYTGSVPAGTNSFTFTYIYPNGDYIATATCTVTDAGGDEDTASFNVLVRNSPPTADITGNSRATVGASYAILLDMSDFGGDDAIISYDVDWGDGTVNSLLSHTYSEPGLYTISIIVFDNDGIWIAGQKHVRVSE